MIEGTYIFNLTEMLKSTAHAADQQARTSLRCLIRPLGIGLIIVGILLWKHPLTFVSIYFVGLGLYLAILRKPLARLLTKRQFAKRPDQNIEVKLQADDRNQRTSHQGSGPYGILILILALGFLHRFGSRSTAIEPFQDSRITQGTITRSRTGDNRGIFHLFRTERLLATSSNLEEYVESLS
ncbi:MAG: hypothetical protein QNL33_12220 [Akkermansiaceae bacterium]|jgi:hypothetical protein